MLAVTSSISKGYKKKEVAILSFQKQAKPKIPTSIILKPKVQDFFYKIPNLHTKTLNTFVHNANNL